MQNDLKFEIGQMSMDKSMEFNTIKLLYPVVHYSAVEGINLVICALI